MDYKALEKMVMGFKKGTIRTVEYTKPLKTLKGVNDIVTKETILNARFGVQYDNIGDVKEARANGELPQENQGLPWGKWKTFPYFIGHKDTDYIRLSLVNGTKIRSKYYINGNEASKSEVEKICLKSETTSTDKAVEILTIKVDNIKSIR